MNKYRIGNLRRVSKPSARKLYNQGVELLIVPCNTQPNNMWGIGHTFRVKDGDGFERDFDKVVSYYEYNNCQNSFLGKYAAFYVAVPLSIAEQ